jgi:ribose transport system substrate-binding protein
MVGKYTLKRKALALTAVSATLLLTAVSAVQPADAAAKKKLNLGMIYYQSNVQAFQAMADGGNSAANVYGNVKLVSAAPSNEDAAKELQLFQSAANVSKDGVVLQTLAGSTFLRAVQAVTKRGIPVITIDAPLPDGSGSNLFITNDNKTVGADLAKAVLAKVPADKTGEVVITTNGAAVPPLQARVAGMIETIKALRPDLTIVGPLTTGNSTANLASIQSVLNAHPDAVAYLSPDDQDAASIAVVSKNTGKKYNAGGCDLEAAALQGVKDGYITAMGSPEHYIKGYLAMQILIDHATKGTAIPAGVWNTADLVVTPANVDAVIAREKTAAARTAYFKSKVATELKSLYSALNK